MEQHEKFLGLAVELSRQGMESNAGGPFGAVIVRDNQVIATGINRVPSTNDPTAHAEITAIKEACQKLGTFDLSDCTLYASCEPCPMCLGAIYWARIKSVHYANTRDNAAGIGFNDSHIYEEIAKPIPERSISFTQLARDDALQVFRDWTTKPDKISY